MAKKEPTPKKTAAAAQPAPKKAVRSALPERLEPGDIVDVHLRVTEGDRERIQVFRGTVIAIRGTGNSRTFTVRRVSRGYGIERIFPLNSPVIAGIDVIRKSKVRRAKLYYLRGKTGREALLKERKVAGESRQPAVEE